MNPSTALLIDHYELTMAQAAQAGGLRDVRFGADEIDFLRQT